jgi:cholera toxin transcriptional activator
VKRYNAAHATVAPVEVIATGGQNNQLVLNYIHSLDNSGENITVRIFAEQQDLSKVCQ